MSIPDKNGLPEGLRPCGCLLNERNENVGVCVFHGSAPSAIDTIESGPFAGLPKPHKVPEGYVMVDEKSFKIILGVLTEEQTREVCLKEAERLRVGRSDGKGQS